MHNSSIRLKNYRK